MTGCSRIPGVPYQLDIPLVLRLVLYIPLCIGVFSAFASEFPSDLSEDDMLIRKTWHDALESAAAGARREWRNELNENSGYVQVISEFDHQRFDSCWRYARGKTTHGSDSRARTSHYSGAACKDRSGTWRMLRERPLDGPVTPPSVRFEPMAPPVGLGSLPARTNVD